MTETKTPATRRPTVRTNWLAQRLREGGERLSTEAGDRARGLVSQGLERSAEALSNVSKLVGDTADGLDERLGQEYGDYARKAASAIENTANNIASKNPDELIEDTRNFVRNSPGLAVAGAAIVGLRARPADQVRPVERPRRRRSLSGNQERRAEATERA